MVNGEEKNSEVKQATFRETYCVLVLEQQKFRPKQTAKTETEP